MPTKGELPSDLDPDEFDDMIRDAARENGWSSYGINPDLVQLGEIPTHVYGCNRGVMREGKPWDGVTLYKAAQKVRARTIEWLKVNPAWLISWRADREMDQRVRALCEARGLRLKPFECPPWMIRSNEELPEPDGTYWVASMPMAQRLRAELEAEIRAADAGIDMPGT